MRIDTRFLRSRVSKRVAILFMIAALVPTSLMAVLTYGNIKRVLEQQAQHELVEISRTYALTLFSRLALAHSTIKNAPQTLQGERQFGLPELFESIEQVQIGMRTANTSPPPLLIIEKSPSEDSSSSIFILGSRAEENGKIPKAKLVPDYLWGEHDTVSAAYNVCVFSREDLLHCEYPETMPFSSPELIGRWDLFLKPEFGADKWTIMATRRYPAVSNPLSDFFSVYIWVAITSVLLISLLSLVQIRRTMGPLERLIDGAKRIASGDYRKIAVRSKDEFAELASAFNKMSSRIEHQLVTLNTLSEIDKKMRNQLDINQLIVMVAEAMRQVLPGATLYVLRNPGKGTDGCIYAHAEGAAFASKNEVRMSGVAFDSLTDKKRGILDSPPSVFPLLTDDQKSWSVALQWQGSDHGMLTLVWSDHILKEDAISELIELANRIAVAIQIEDRDQRLLYQANFDSLTGLYNRHGLNERISAIPVDSSIAVFFVDLDRFKLVNDNFGHKTGDALLQVIATRLKEFAQDGIVGRLGGDEFVLVMFDAKCAEAVQRQAHVLMKNVTQPCVIGPQQFLMTCSVGIAMHPCTPSSGLTLIERADIAMYNAKENGRNSFRFYCESMTAENHARLQLEADLRLALERDELVLHYQPKFCVDSGLVIGAEALVRWMHPVRGLIPPAHFIHLAEETGLIVPLGAYVLRAACIQNAIWRRTGTLSLCIAVNVSAIQFLGPDFVTDVANVLKETGLPPDSLEIEVTESMIMDDVDQAIVILNGLRDLGVTLSIDDFGTGYSSLAYLKRFPINILKIDQSFVRGIQEDKDDRIIIESIIGLAHNLNLQVVAEGVETAAQLDYLKRQGCDAVQGYYFSRPVEPGHFARLLETDMFSGKDA